MKQKLFSIFFALALFWSGNVCGETYDMTFKWKDLAGNDSYTFWEWYISGCSEYCNAYRTAVVTFAQGYAANGNNINTANPALTLYIIYNGTSDASVNRTNYGNINFPQAATYTVETNVANVYYPKLADFGTTTKKTVPNSSYYPCGYGNYYYNDYSGYGYNAFLQSDGNTWNTNCNSKIFLTSVSAGATNFTSGSLVIESGVRGYPYMHGTLQTANGHTVNLTIDAKYVYNVVANSSDNTLGTASANKSSVTEGGSVTLTATEKGGTFLGWSLDGGTNIIAGTSSQLTYSPTLGADAGSDGQTFTYTAVFEASGQKYTVNYGVNIDAGGSITTHTYGNSATIFASGKDDFEGGTSVTLTATANTENGYRFVKWSNNVETATITFNVTKDTTLTAQFVKTYTISTACEDEAGNATSKGSVTAGGDKDENSEFNISATINDPANYYLSDWLRDGISMGVRTNPLPVTVTKAETYTAVITAKEWTLTVNSDNTSLGTVSGGKKCYDGETTTITATPANSFSPFVKWQKNGKDYAGGASINVTVNANDTYTAFFSGRNIIEVDIPNATYVDRNATYSLRGNSNGTSSESSGYYVDVQFNASTDALYSVDGIKYNGSTMSFTTKTIESIEQPCGNRKITNLACYNATGDVYMFKIHWTQPWGEDRNDTYPNDRTINDNQQAAYDDDLGAIYVYGYTKEYEWDGQATLRAMGMYFVTGQRCSDDIKIPVGTYDINCSGDPGTVMSYQSGMDKDLSGGWAQTQGVKFGYYLLDKGTVTVTKSGSTYTINVNAKNSYGNDLISTMTIDESVITGTIPNYTLNVTTDGHGTAKVYRYDCSGNENLVSNSGSYKQGSYFKLEATPASGYAFDYWTIDGVDEHFTNNPETLDGLYTNATVTAHFFMPSEIVLEDNRENSFYDTFKAKYNGAEDVTVVYNRQFPKSKWATLCLPFDVNSALLNSLDMAGRVYEFKKAEGNAETGINLYFATAETIKAGKGYIVNANAKLASKSSFRFPDVKINLKSDKGDELNSQASYDELEGTSTEGNIALVGTLRKGRLRGVDGKNRYMGLKDNKIYYPNISTTEGSLILAYRGIFRSIEGTLNAERIRIVVDGEDMGELLIENDGRMTIDNDATRKFVKDGVLYIEREGVIYDAQGKRVESL